MKGWRKLPNGSFPSGVRGRVTITGVANLYGDMTAKTVEFFARGPSWRKENCCAHVF
jgi:hypothetical protein